MSNINVLRTKTLSNKFVQTVFSADDEPAVLESLKRRSESMRGRTITVYAYRDADTFELFSIADGKYSSATRNRDKARAELPAVGEIIAFEPPAQTRARRVSRPTPPVPATRRQWETAVTVNGRNFTLTGTCGEKHMSKDGQGAEGKPGQETVMLSVYAALRALHPEFTASVTVFTNDRNVTRILNGEMQSRKYPQLVGDIRTRMSQFTSVSVQ